MTVNKDQAVHDWLSSNPERTDTFFNFLEEHANSYAIVPIAGESVIKRYINGSALREYVFALQTMQSLSQTTDDVNTQTMYIMRQWQDWIEEQETAGNYPDFGEKCSGYRLENLSNMPQLAMTYTDEQMAKYQFMARLIYEEDN